MNLFKLTILTGSTALSVNAATVFLSTDFTGSTPSGTTLSNIVYTANGVADPGDLTVNNLINNNGSGDLFTTTTAAGHLAVANNIGTGGSFEVDIPIMLTSSDILLTSATFGITQFTGAGALNSATRTLSYSITVTETLSGTSLGTVTGTGTGNSASSSDTVNLSFGAGILLDSTLDYTFTLTTFEGSPSAGVNTGFDSISFEGEFVPEPSSTALLALGGLALLRRKR